ncbi:histidine phosphatase family protein [Candidatus Sulfurimonas marisnigri]|uniref:Histidine phosphatase family protein n=1 Tax=Candidatus Sulfurimonas marisnigri TaxID=2740405 RepID=A0A7S7RQQ7_9BACT|nr:histidine phosphatase family protein [Candidatus Sulfurimonas marisnigri]QOY54941.1 histidine phosphatase family protein [Candidatus Sulfurimonas marisnigri]
MKKLYIIRHAKSSWKDSSLSDFDRPLNKRGRVDAPLMGKVLKGKKVSPDAIISSPALRAKTTAQNIAKNINFTKPITYDENIYEANDDTLLYVMKKLNKEDSVVFIFGHNPGLNMLAESLVGLDENIPTCGIVEIEFDCKKWSEISSKNAKLISFDYPKMYS